MTNKTNTCLLYTQAILGLLPFVITWFTIVFISELFQLCQVVVGSFLPGHQLEQKHKKQRTELAPIVTPISVSVLSAEEIKGGYSGIKPIVTSSVTFPGDNSASLNPMHGSRTLSFDNKTSSLDDDSKGPGQSNCEVSC